MSDLPSATLGRTGLRVTQLGYGAMELRPRAGREDLSNAEIDAVLNAVLDAGINFIDTSPDYGPSEDHIGRAIAHRRDEFVLASKCGCVVDPEAQGRFEHRFDRPTVRAAVERSLRRMNTDHLDLVQFHMSPARSVLEEGEALDELSALRDEGMVRFIGISATLPHVVDHLAMGVFDAFQIPYSAVEREHEQIITTVADAGSGTIIRGGVARGLPEPPPPNDRQPVGYREQFVRRRERFDDAAIDDLLDGESTASFLLRFTLSHPDLHTTIVGTSNLAHLMANVATASRGPLPADVYELAKARFGSG
jgi:aryl-alcohol dehydrogenase-like predicted oxidoreductase